LLPMRLHPWKSSTWKSDREWLSKTLLGFYSRKDMKQHTCFHWSKWT
jgi:hypothetical protein